MRRIIPSLFLITTIIACEKVPSDFKKLDLGAFEISIPHDWRYISKQGEDSYIGSFYRDTIELLGFDYSRFGYSSSLLPTIKEYLKDYEHEWMPRCPFCEPNVAYTRKEHIQFSKEHLDPKDSIIDVREFIKPHKKIQKINEKMRDNYPNADYLCTLTYQDSNIYIPIIIPESIKQHNIKTNSSFLYQKKTIWPLKGYCGMTGLYIRNKSFTFNIVGYNLSEKDQNDALIVFTTISFKK